MTSASITLTFEDWVGGSILRAFYVKNGWNPPPSSIGWQYRDTGLSWDTPGAKTVGIDIYDGEAFSDSTWSGSGNVTKTYPLDATVVQGWINNPATNQGLIFVNNEVNDEYLRIFMSNDGTVSRHPLLTINYADSSCINTTSGQWTQHNFASQSGTFTAEFDATPSASNIDAVMGLSLGTQTAFTGLAVIPRFYTNGLIDARNGDTYQAVSSIPYTGGTSYHFRLVVNLNNHTYSAYVTPAGGSEQVLATNYAFRTEQATVASLDNLAMHVESVGSLVVCDFESSTTDSTAPVVSMTAPSNGAIVSGANETVTATATDNVGVVGVQFLLDGQPLQSEDLTSPYTIQWDTTGVTDGPHTLSARARDAAGNTTTSSTVPVTVDNPDNCQTATLGQTPWPGASFANQTGTFTAEFDATPSASPMDAVIGLSDDAQSSYANLAVIPRFNPSGFIDARNGDVYAAATSVSYAAGVTYHFRIAVNLGTDSYSAWVRVGGGAEQLIASNYAFRTEQTSVLALDRWNITTETSGASIQVCNFVTSGGGGDQTAPTVTMTSPSGASPVSGTITVSATANDNVGVAGVYFIVDGADIQPEDTTNPYSIQYDTTALTNGTHTFSARARDAAGNPATATPVTVTVDNPTNPQGRPRIWLDASTLNTLRQRALANDPAWITLRDKCNQYLSGTVLDMPNGQKCLAECSVSGPDICCGYQGSKLHPAVINIGLCYQVGLQIGHPNTQLWANKGVAVLTEMSQYTFYEGDMGFQIRFIATAMAIGYDWFHSQLSASLKSDLRARMEGWIAYPESRADDWGAHHPSGNYFAGWYAAKAYVALAMEGDDPDGATMWADWRDDDHGGGLGSIGSHYGVAHHHTNYLNGGGFAGGWQYGDLAVRNMSEPALAVRSAKNIDIINGGGSLPAYEYPLNTALHLIHFTWPSQLYMEDRDVHKEVCPTNPSQPPALLATTLSTLLAKPEWQRSFTPMLQDYAKKMRDLHGTLIGDIPQQWLNFLFWDESAPRTDFANLPKSYLSEDSHLAMRSDWGTGAVWASFRARAVADGDSYQFPDAGSLLITRGDTPFVVPVAFLQRCYAGSPNTNYFNDVWDDMHTNDTRQVFNIFYTGTSSGQQYKYVDATPAPQTRISKYSPHGDYGPRISRTCTRTSRRGRATSRTST